MRLSASELVSRLNASYWFVPLLVTVGGALLAIGLLVVDARIRLDADAWHAILRPSSADGARALLSAVVGAMITAISVTFSVTIVALTVAAQHFGPRVLNSFVRQTSAQLVLGTFMATFVYTVLVLGAIRGNGPDTEIPELATSGVVVLVILSIGALIFAGPNPAIYTRLLESLAELGWIVARAHDRQLLRDQADTIWRAAQRSLHDPVDVEYVAAKHEQTMQQLTGRPAATRRT